MPTNSKIRYAVVGLGHIAQVAVLPAFKHAGNSELVGFISNDSEKIKKLSHEYNVQKSWSYEEYEAALASGTFDAVYIALPNDMHREFAVKAADKGIHILVEKPMAITSADCKKMIEAADRNAVKLMVAYRLHFEKTNIDAIELIASGKIGTPRIFNSTFTMQVREENIRTSDKHGGGPLNDIGIYCINAARYLFKEEPVEVQAMAVKSADPRFSEVEETLSAVMRFPGDKLASFSCSFGAQSMGRFEVVGTKGSVSLDPAYEYAKELEAVVNIGGKKQHHKTPKHDQFAAELEHFSECILKGSEPRPSGSEGLNDLLVIEAIRESTKTGKTVKVVSGARPSQPDKTLVEEKPGVKKPHLVKVESASKS